MPMPMIDGDDGEDDAELDLRCRRCSAQPSERPIEPPIDRRELLAVLAPGLAVRFLDELGRTDLRDSQDTLVDDCYLSLLGCGLADEAARIYRAWLEVAVPRGWARAHGAG